MILSADVILIMGILDSTLLIVAILMYRQVMHLLHEYEQLTGHPY